MVSILGTKKLSKMKRAGGTGVLRTYAPSRHSVSHSWDSQNLYSLQRSQYTQQDCTKGKGNRQNLEVSMYKLPTLPLEGGHCKQALPPAVKTVCLFTEKCVCLGNLFEIQGVRFFLEDGHIGTT